MPRTLVLPEPLLEGLAIAGGLAVVFAVVFAVGERRYPTQRRVGDTDAGERKRRAEIGRYLDATGERYAEDHPVSGQTVAFYLPDRDVAITFDARAYFRLLGTDTYPILVEHEMPGHHLGARLPFETPETGAPEERDTDPRDDAGAFAVFDLSPDASGEELRAAYREKVKEVHPDQGGDEDAFHRVREAYAAARQRT